MKSHKLTILINKPLHEVFAFTVDASNTHLWIDSIERETSYGYIEVGTEYVNVDKNGISRLYHVSDFKHNEVFELTEESGNYTVRYTYTPISENETKLEYKEWTKDNSLEPFDKANLEKLKAVIEEEPDFTITGLI